MARILVVDDEPSIREFFEIFLTDEGYDVEVLASGHEALQAIEKKPFDLVITDLSMPEIDGLKVLEGVKSISPETLVLMITAFATAESAVEAMKLGAYDYVMKPFKVDEIRLIIHNALEKLDLRRENKELKREVHRKKGFDHFVGISESMEKLFDLIERVASGKSNVLILGESGTGKELVAKAIHENSPRSGKPFVSINCGAIPENLIESELFGYQKGAFTGANTNKMGLFEAAQHGTFFLDEVGELPQQTQVKLLKVLQDRSVRRIASTTSTSIDVRIIAATNRDIEKEVLSGTFREDLFYRLNVIQIRIPPLRERKVDIPVLVKFFLKRFSEQDGNKAINISPESLDCLLSYDFPGNVRELENIIEQSIALSGTDLILPESLPEKVRQKKSLNIENVSNGSFENVDLEKSVDALEKKLILEALHKASGVKKKAAELLNISFRSMRYRLVKHGIETEDKDDE